MDRSFTKIRQAGAALTLAFAVIAGTIATSIDVATVDAVGVEDNDWLGVVNSYRAMSGLGPVVHNSTWDEGTLAHSRYMILNGITHTEVAGAPGYTAAGDQAGRSGNVAVTSSTTWTARQFVELWLTGPFHAIGVLRHSLTATSYGQVVEPGSARWRAAGTLDVLRGIGSAPRPGTPIVFPGRDATTPLFQFIAETPNPVTLVGWDASRDAGLPLIAMFPNRVTTASATLTGPNGPEEVRVLHQGNTGDATAKAIMNGDNAVVVVPGRPLANGRYTATVTSDGGSVTWSFTVEQGAPLPVAGTPAPAAPAPPAQVPTAVAAITRPLATSGAFEPLAPHRVADSRSQFGLVRLRANQPQDIRLADAGVTAVSANFTIDSPSAPGYLSVYNKRASVPEVSTLNFTNMPVANQMIVPLTDGTISLFSPVDVDVIIDVNGRFRAASSSTSGFVPTTPARILDTRNAGGRFAPGVARTVQVHGAGGVPAGATAVAVNLTVVHAESNGFLTAYPGGTVVPAVSAVSNVNFVAGETRPNSAVVPIGANGAITLVSTAGTDVLVDVTGYFVGGSGQQFTPLEPVRMLDTRYTGSVNQVTNGQRLAAGQTMRLQVAGVQGVPAGATAVSINITAVQTQAAGFVTVFPGPGQPEVSNLNVDPATPAIANGSMVKLDATGGLTIFTSSAVHVLVDINGVWR